MPGFALFYGMLGAPNARNMLVLVTAWCILADGNWVLSLNLACRSVGTIDA